MKRVLSTPLLWSILTVVATYIVSLLILFWSKQNSKFAISLGSQLVGYGLFGLTYLHSYASKIKSQLSIKWFSLILMMVIVAFAITTRLLFIEIYPFVAVGDEVRDGGLNSYQILNHEIINILEMGRYEAHGLIIPALITPFYKLFGPTIYSYRIPAVLLGLASIFFTFIYVKLANNLRTAMWSALLLISLPLHMFYSRTEVVIAFSLFWSPIIMIAFFSALSRRKLIDYMFLGFTAGMAMNFHGSIKFFALNTLIITVVEGIITALQYPNKDKWLKIIVPNIALCIFVLIGFGPKIVYTTPSLFFHTHRLENNLAETKRFEPKIIFENYFNSLQVFTNKPTTAWFPDHKPIFDPLISIFFLLGIGMTLIKKNKVNCYLVLIILLTLLTNSAVTEMVNGDHRLSPLLSPAVVFASVGIIGVVNLSRNKYLSYSVGIILTLILVIKTLQFFTDQPANLNRPIHQYLSMHTIEIIKQLHQVSSSRIEEACISLSPNNFEYNHHEQRHYFMPTITTEILSNSSLSDAESIISFTSCDDTPTTTNYFTYQKIDCTKKSFLCPPNFTDSLIIYLTEKDFYLYSELSNK